MKRDKIVYLAVTILFGVLMVMFSLNYFTMHDTVVDTWKTLGAPIVLIYPLAIARIAGVITIVFIPNTILKQLAYAAFTLELVLAISFHVWANDGMWGMAVGCLILLVISFIYYTNLLEAEDFNTEDAPKFD